MNTPLRGIRVIEFAGLGPAPYAGQLLADMGAEVIVIERPGHHRMAIESRGKRSVALNLKQPEAVTAALALIDSADLLIEAFRPGVMEKLGLGPAICRGRRPQLVYGRMTGWGQTGPWRTMAGHDINYIGLTGALYAMGRADDVPVPPLNLVGDYGGGSLFLTTGLLAALHRASADGVGDVVDVAIVDGTISMFGLMLSMYAQGNWSLQRENNMLDGGAPYYRCYRCSDNRFVAVGALEPQFFSAMLSGLGIAPAEYGEQRDSTLYARQHQLLEGRFAEHPRDHWARLFDGVDACVTPVLDVEEAALHPQMQARAALTRDAGVLHPHPAPRFTNDSDAADYQPPENPHHGEDTVALLREVGLTDAMIDAVTAQS